MKPSVLPLPNSISSLTSLGYEQSSLENEVLRNDGELEDFVSLTRENLQRFIRDHFPTTLQLKTQVGHMSLM